jgi:hypothetical protein
MLGRPEKARVFDVAFGGIAGYNVAMVPSALRPVAAPLLLLLPLLLLRAADNYGTCVAPTTDGGCAQSLKNGRFWTQGLHTGNQRHAYVLGMLDSWEFRTSVQDRISGAELSAFVAGNSRTEDLTAMIDSVYGQPENLSVPIGWIAVACLAVQRGEWKRDAIMTELRAHLERLRPGTSQETSPLGVIFKRHDRLR